MSVRENLARQQIYIPATKPETEITLRVAAYCRVSTDSDDQINSFIAQNSHYNELITSHDRWQLVDIYADEGITGTSAKKRKDFQRMLADCRKGKIDKILVKSISRFARNTAECLEAVRELKSLGIGILFEEHNIDTKTVSSEMLTAVLASCAQAESESISKNMRWSYQKRMESGRFITCNAPFGYRLVNGTLAIEPKEAEIVRKIFALYLQGFSTTEISKHISAIGMPTRTGSIQWGHKAICYILQNEKYIGDALLQKKYSTDTLPVKKVPNTGERDQYYVENSHPAIITKEVFECVQMLYKSKRPEITGAKKQKHDLSLKIKCGKCGSYLHRKINGGILYWVCRKHNNTGDCDLAQILDTTIKDA